MAQDDPTLIHKRDVEAKLKANPQLKIISNHTNYDSSRGSNFCITTVLATVDACVTSPSTVADITGLASDFAD
jgi:hypothetical protein